MNSYMFINNYFYELPEDIQSYIYDIKNKLEYENEMKKKLKFCKYGNAKFYKSINNKYTYCISIFLEDFIKLPIQIYNHINTIDMIKKTFIIKYTNEMVRNIITQKKMNKLIDKVKLSFENNVKDYHYDKDNSKYSHSQLKRQFDLIKRLFDDKYRRIIIK